MRTSNKLSPTENLSPDFAVLTSVNSFTAFQTCYLKDNLYQCNWWIWYIYYDTPTTSYYLRESFPEKDTTLPVSLNRGTGIIKSKTLSNSWQIKRMSLPTKYIHHSAERAQSSTGTQELLIATDIQWEPRQVSTKSSILRSTCYTPVFTCHDL